MQIDSDYIMPEIEQHFKVSAGPGAGKTHWLVQHIKNILHNSKRLGKTRKIACITYTNIAVETILERLGTSSEHVEVSTIHSFLYKHIVKPYVGFIAGNYDLDVTRMDGHDDYSVYTKFVVEWVENHPNVAALIPPFSVNQLTRLPDNKTALCNWLASLSYDLLGNGNIDFKCDKSKAFNMNGARRRYLNNNAIAALDSEFHSYKAMYWQRGILHHDDVLFFSYQIIQQFPFVLDVLRAKFPYFFVDEFQDSNPIQVAILDMIGQDETIVGIIGDIAQSIYGFQGAEATQFTSFTLPGMVEYEMPNNRRSTNNIIDVLNIVRPDMEQIKFRDVVGERPIIFIGDRATTYLQALALCQDENIHSLSRDNITSNAMRKSFGGIDLNNNLLKDLYTIDSNSYRKRFVIDCIRATELAREKKFKDAIKEFSRHGLEKNEALYIISVLLLNYDAYKGGTLLDLYNIIKDKIRGDIAGFKAGAPMTFYESHTYQEMALCVNIPEDNSLHRTIHKSKGDEFDNVMLVLKDSKDLAFLLKPDITNEEYRVHYVAISRAKERLFISVPSLSESDKGKLSDSFEII